MRFVNMNDKTIFVTGSAGFIGANLILKLLKENENMHIIGIISYKIQRRRGGTMGKIINAARRWICVMLVLVMTAITCVEPVKAVTGVTSTAWVDNLESPAAAARGSAGCL